MNSTVQAIRAIPELQIALGTQVLPSFAPFPVSPLSCRSLPLDVLPRALRDLYVNMSRTTESVIPSAFLAVLRHVVPQFNELDRSKSSPMMGYAQQGTSAAHPSCVVFISISDAEECWTQTINALKDIPGIDSSGASVAGKKFVDQFLVGEMRRE